MIGRNAAATFARYALCGLMCFFIVVSFVFIFTAVFSQSTGYDVYALNEETGRNEKLYHYDASTGDDDRYAAYEQQGLQLTKNTTRVLSLQRRNAAYAVAQTVCLIFVVLAMYVSVWKIGNRDINRVETGRLTENKWRGLPIGALASLPAFAVYIALLLSKIGICRPGFLSVYRALNAPFYAIIHWIYGQAVLATDLSVLQMILLFFPVLFLPVVCTVAYAVGYADIRISEKLIYQKK